MHGLEAEYSGRVDFHFMDADDPATRDLQRELGFRYQPEFYLFDGEGNLVQQWVGYVDAEEFRSAFDQLLAVP